ncbi:MAG TPA: ABC transporter permease [Candidatus Paceibacterota bacterium]|nr:ABC transporter permease [Verrucomicrobiota bacterium]HRY48931.1 ABC transporter permease [Candidatus Paceibacterota bacterium]
MKPSRFWLGTTAIGLYLFLYAPIFIVTLHSFNQARFGAGWRGFTLRWYRVLWDNPQAWSAMQNTLILASISTLIATVLGSMLGYALHRRWFPGKRWVAWFLFVPVVIPDIVMAVALMLFFSLLREVIPWGELGMTTMVLAHVTFQIPFVALVVRSRLVGLDPAYVEAAQDLGATPWQTFWRVTFPLILPGIVAGGLLAFTLSLDDFVVSFFTSGPGSTNLPILIYSSVKRGITPDINALSALMVLASILGTVWITWLQQPHKAKEL